MKSVYRVFPQERLILKLSFVGLGVVCLLSGCWGTGSQNIGVVDGHLSLCPRSPNCVSTRDIDEQHGIAPLTYSGDPTSTINHLAQTVDQMSGAEVITKQSQYMHVEFTTLLMRFVDDVEFMLEPTAQTIHFRSASRIGHGDLGVNRKRMETIREMWQPYAAKTTGEK